MKRRTPLMKVLNLLLFLLVSHSAYNQQIPAQSLDVLAGEDWTGELTYLDYSSNERVTMPVQMAVSILGDGVYQIAYSYPNEPKANSRHKIRISRNGKRIAGNEVTGIERSDDGSLVIFAESNGRDDNEKARFYFTYRVGGSTFISRKEVMFAGRSQKILRNEYRLER